MPDAKQKILLVEDDELIQNMYKTKLESEGFEVVVAADGAKGLEQARSGKPDIILLDVILPQLDGFSVLKELKDKDITKKIPVIMLTNLGTDEDKAKGAELGAVDYLIKTNNTPSQVNEKVRQYLKKI